MRFRVPGIELKNPSSLEIRKKYEKITKSPTPGRAPKIRKKYRKNTKTVIFEPFLYFFCIFSYFRGPTRGGGFRSSGLEGFLSSIYIPGTRNRKNNKTAGNNFDSNGKLGTEFVAFKGAFCRTLCLGLSGAGFPCFSSF